jgi:histidinol-phosphate aminotransferase
LRDFIASASDKAVIFVDEAYIELTDDPAANTMVDLVQKGENVIVSRTMSKIHGMAGLRIGYALARPDIAERVRNYGMAGPNVIGLRGAIASLQDEAFQAMSREKMAAGRQLIYGLCDEMGMRYADAQTNFVFFHTGKPIQEFQKAMYDKGILIGRPFPPFLDWARVSIGLEEDMQQFAVAMREVMA